MEKNRTNSLWLGNRPYPQGLLHPVQVLSNPISPGVNTFSSPSLSLSFFGCTRMHAESYFPDQGSSLFLLQWKHRVLTTGLPGKSPGKSLWFDFLAHDLACLQPLYDASSPTRPEQVVNGKQRIQDLLHDTDTTTSTRLEVSLWWAGEESWSHALFSRIDAHRLPSC